MIIFLYIIFPLRFFPFSQSLHPVKKRRDSKRKLKIKGAKNKMMSLFYNALSAFVIPLSHE